MKYKVTVDGVEYDVEVERVGVPRNTSAVVASAPVVASAAAPVASSVTASAAASQPAAAKAAPAVSAGGTVVAAPLPGSVIAVKVSTGATVNQGDVVALIEAMKMENEIVAPCAGVVADIYVAKGDNVSSGDALLAIEA